MLKLRTVRGIDVPIEAERLTRGDAGLMLSWLREQREHMVAVLLYRDDTLIGWCAAIRMQTKEHWFWGPARYTETVKISTFVDPRYRGKGFAKRLLSKMAWVLHIADPKTVVQYGAPQDDAGFFNKTYEKTIAEQGLKPDHSLSREAI